MTQRGHRYSDVCEVMCVLLGGLSYFWYCMRAATYRVLRSPLIVSRGFGLNELRGYG